MGRGGEGEGRGRGNGREREGREGGEGKGAYRHFFFLTLSPGKHTSPLLDFLCKRGFRHLLLS